MGSSGSKGGAPAFFGGQEDAASAAIFDILLPQLYGGPNAALERGVQRGQANTSRVLAQRGLTGSGLEARALADVAAGGEEARQGQQFDLLDRLLTPAGTTGARASGAARLSEGLSTAGQAATAAAKLASSDVRLKQNIQPIDSPYGAIGLSGVSWDWQPFAAKYGLVGRAAGVIAQDVRSVYPDAVVRGDHGYLMVDYGYLERVLYG